MTIRESIILVIKEIIELLSPKTDKDWIILFHKYENIFCNANAEDISYYCSDLLQIYGGTGSFNDLVLYNDGNVLIDKNKKLNTLREQLLDI